MGFGETKTGNGFLAKIDPRVKLGMLVVWSFVLALATGFPGALAGLAGSIVLVILSGPEKLSAFVLRLLSINVFLIFIWLVLPFSFSMPGEKLVGLGPLTLTREGVYLSARLSLQALGITAAAMAITTTTTVFQLMMAARSLGAPEKLTAMLSLMMRYVKVIKDEYERLVWAMKIRGFKASTSLHCLKSYANLAGILLVRGLDRGERVYAAMICRGYKGRFYFTLERQINRKDILTLIVFAAVAALVVILNVNYRANY
ncbi:MAG: cobalt ECF transporter T component CbiQ [Deltaproteobacteria bacterium]|jgi:cobalt/nickel transport system permease protein|nr:cobalt ECF transporter T component CbiQ [Deltaproteobacteria bacterium]